MIKFYKNRELAQKLNINLAKWKRWSREFLPPDPLGGMQSGYARHYNIDEAFKVFLGGHLVSSVKCTIPEAKKILHDLREWLSSVGMYQNSGTDRQYNHSEALRGAIKDYVVFIRPPGPSEKADEYHYTIRGIISGKSISKQDVELREERFVETSIPGRKNHRSIASLPGVKMLNITAVFRIFMNSLDLPQTRFPG